MKTCGQQNGGQQTCAPRTCTEAVCGALAAICFLLAGLTGTIRFMAGSAALLEREMRAFAPAEVTGLPGSEYAGVAAMTAGFLTGETDTFQYLFTAADGAVYQCFQPHEAAHMADCRGLIALDQWIALGCALAAALLAVAGWRLHRRAEKPCRAFASGAFWGLWLFVLMALALGVWAVLDFDGFFRRFHELAFDNDGWLLDPRTDLLIRLMPAAFFIDLGLKGLLCWLPWPLALFIWLAFTCKKGNRRGTWGIGRRCGENDRIQPLC